MHVGVVGGQQRDRIAVARHQVAVPVGADDAHLDALDRRVDVTGGAGGGGLFAQGVPRLDRPAQLDLDPVEHRGADPREAEFGERVQPAGLERDAVCAQVGGDIGDIVNQEVRQQVSPVQVGAVPDQGARSGSSQNQATSERTSSDCTIAIRRCGGISKPRSSRRPNLPRGLSGL